MTPNEFVAVVGAICETIRELGDAPSGPLYASIMAHTSLSFDDYIKIIGTLKRAGLVRERANVLTWIGPSLDGK
jgi:hypothetical protein